MLSFPGSSAQDFVITFILITCWARIFLLLCKEDVPSSYLRKASQRHVHKGIDLKIIIKCVVERVVKAYWVCEGFGGKGVVTGNRRAEEGSESWNLANDGNACGFFYFAQTWRGQR